jgi:hypothetical protein
LILGDFGLYAAACGCTVYMFEIQPMMVSLIQISIRLNNFTPSSVNLYHNAVNDLPFNSSLELEAPLSHGNSSTEIQTIRLDDIAWPSSIFVLKIDFDDYELNVLRSGEKLFRENSIQHLILRYDTVANSEFTKRELIEYLRTVLRPKYIYLIHPSEKKLYGPLNNRHLKQLPTQQDIEQPMIGLYAVFDKKIDKRSIEAESYNTGTFFD